MRITDLRVRMTEGRSKLLLNGALAKGWEKVEK